MLGYICDYAVLFFKVSVSDGETEESRGQRVTLYPPTLKAKKWENVFARCVCAGNIKSVFAEA